MPKLSPQLLSGLNLSESQAAVYLAALELGTATMQKLANKSKIKRTSIYNFIDDLKEKGLITETMKKKHKVYGAVHPKQLVEMGKTHLVELEELLPELLAIHNRAPQKPRVTFYEGLPGTEEVYADMLKDKQPIFAYEDLEHMLGAMRQGFAEYFPTERARRNIPFKSILRDSPAAQKFVKSNIRLLRQSKFVESGDWKTEINIYGNKVALMSFRAKPPFCVLIEDPDIAATLQTAWNELWKRLGPAVG